MRSTQSIALALVFTTTVVCSQGAHACAPIPEYRLLQNGERSYDDIKVLSEDVLIIWDAKSGTEHFVRRADFESDSKGFGFLVPTPTVPLLAEAPDEVFERLETVMKPPVIHRKEYEFVWGAFFSDSMVKSARLPSTANPGEKTGAVRILDRVKVAGFDAVVLEANDAKALNEWLNKNKFVSRPGLEPWLKIYVDKKWKITAFKVDSKAGLSPVRMSFKTDKPFHPYREPAYQRKKTDSGRNFRLFFVGPERARGTIGDGTHKWPGKLTFAAPINELAVSQTHLLAGVLPNDTSISPSWLSTFVDKSSPRPGHDELYLVKSDNQDQLRPKPIVIVHLDHINIPLDLIIPAMLLLGGFIYFRRRKKKRATAN